MEENNYTFAPYSKTLPENSALYTVEVYKDKEKTELDYKLESAYSIVDQDAKEVAVVYCIRQKNIDINNGYATSQKTAVAFVAISIEERQVLDIYLNQTPYVNNSYESKVFNGVNDYDYSNNILEADPASIISGATFSAAGIKTAAQTAYDIFVSQYAE